MVGGRNKQKFRRSIFQNWMTNEDYLFHLLINNMPRLTVLQINKGKVHQHVCAAGACTSPNHAVVSVHRSTFAMQLTIGALLPFCITIQSSRMPDQTPMSYMRFWESL